MCMLFALLYSGTLSRKCTAPSKRNRRQHWPIGGNRDSFSHSLRLPLYVCMHKLHIAKCRENCHLLFDCMPECHWSRDLCRLGGFFGHSGYDILGNIYRRMIDAITLHFVHTIVRNFPHYFSVRYPDSHRQGSN